MKNLQRHLTASLITILLLLVAIIAQSSTAEEAVIDATGQVDLEDVTDLDSADAASGDLGNMNDLNELLDALEGEKVDSSTGAVDDVDRRDAEEGGSETATADEKFNDVATESQDEEVASNEPINSDVSDEAATRAESSQQGDESQSAQQQQAPAQTGPFVDIFGEVLLSLEMVDETHAQVHQHFTNEALRGKKVVGLYFSADWCGPCRQFTPDLVTFYEKMNARRGKQDEFEIVWISRCRSIDDFGQYFTHMKWLALPPQEAMGQRGQYLGEKYKVKSIPTLVLLDEIGNVITTDARNKIPQDKAGIGFPWKSPMSILVSTIVPKSFRLLMKSQMGGVVDLVKKVLLGGGGSDGGLGALLGRFREALGKAAAVGGQR